MKKIMIFAVILLASSVFTFSFIQNLNENFSNEFYPHILSTSSKNLADNNLLLSDEKNIQKELSMLGVEISEEEERIVFNQKGYFRDDVYVDNREIFGQTTSSDRKGSRFYVDADTGDTIISKDLFVDDILRVKDRAYFGGDDNNNYEFIVDTGIGDAKFKTEDFDIVLGGEDGTNEFLIMSGKKIENPEINYEHLFKVDSTGLVHTRSQKITIENGYTNFGNTEGEEGYGFRDNNGTMEYKDEDGVWQDFTSIASGSSLWTDAGSHIYATNGGSSGVVVTDSGRLGVGTNNPSEALDVYGKVALSGQQVLHLPDQTDFNGTIILGNGGTNLTHSGGNDGLYNTFVGINAGVWNTTGYNNTFVGKNAGMSNTEGSSNSFFGWRAGEDNTTGFYNTFIGRLAGSNNTTGYFNTFIGAGSGASNISGTSNIFLGSSAGGSNNMGNSNIFIGENSGFDNTNGRYNMFIGQSAGADNINGEYNVYLGAGAGRYSTGSNNIFLGGNSGAYETGSNLLYIENSNSFSPLIWGDFANDEIRINGDLHIVNELRDSSGIPGNNGQVLTSLGAGTDWVDASTLYDSDWSEESNPADFLRARAGGIAVSEATLYGVNADTHINLGFGNSLTGESGQDREYATVGGGIDNEARHSYSTVAGGYGNIADDASSFVGGGYQNFAFYRSTVAGGWQNTADEDGGTISGGRNNTTGFWATIGGGRYNIAEYSDATVGGGYTNRAEGYSAIIAGGSNNTISNTFSVTASTIGGGTQNQIADVYSTISGGAFNQISGIKSAIPGGSYLQIGDRSFGFRGGIGADPTSLLDASGSPDTFHIVDTHLHFNFTNADADFRVDGTTDHTLFVDASTNRVGIGTNTPSSPLHVIGKATITGGVDPPYVSFSSESHDSIKKFAKDIDEHERVMLFWNEDAHRMESYVVDDKKFYAIDGSTELEEIIEEHEGRIEELEEGFEGLSVASVIGESVGSASSADEQSAVIEDRLKFLEEKLAKFEEVSVNVDLLLSKGEQEFIENLTKLVTVSENGLTIDGDLKASNIDAREGNFEKVFARDQVIFAKGLVGRGKIETEDGDVVIKTEKITENSRIMLTPIDRYSQLYVSRIEAGESFTVKMDDERDHDVEFDWMIVEETE